MEVVKHLPQMTLEDLNSFTAVGHCLGNAAQPDLAAAMQRKYGNGNAVRRGTGKEEKNIVDVFIFSLS